MIMKINLLGGLMYEFSYYIIRPYEALLVVDMQNDIVAEGAPLETKMRQEMLPRLKNVKFF